MKINNFLNVEGHWNFFNLLSDVLLVRKVQSHFSMKPRTRSYLQLFKKYFYNLNKVKFHNILNNFTERYQIVGSF